jgi:hypothetical protein
VDDGICRSRVHIQLDSYISDRYLSVFSHQSINLFNTLCYWLSGRTAQAVFIDDVCSVTLEPFCPLLHLHLYNTVFSKLC